MNFSFGSGVLKNGDTIELTFEAVTTSEFSKATEVPKDGAVDYRLHNTIELRIKNNVVAEGETEYYYPAIKNNIWTQKGIKSIGKYTRYNSEGLAINTTPFYTDYPSEITVYVSQGGAALKEIKVPSGVLACDKVIPVSTP